MSAEAGRCAPVSSRGGRRSRAKGCRVERNIVHRHVDAGLVAERVPLSGAAHGSFGDDVLVELEWRDAPLRLEVKGRKDRTGFATLLAWLGDADALAVKVDREAPFYVVPEHIWFQLLKRGEG